MEITIPDFKFHVYEIVAETTRSHVAKEITDFMDKCPHVRCLCLEELYSALKGVQ
jgi:hypothetical protein